MKKIFNQSGASMVVITAAMITVLGFAALVTDIGMAIYEKQRLSNAIDAAALAAMQEIDKDDETVIDTAIQYAQLNGVDPSEITVTINPDRKGVRIDAAREVQYFFARAIGISRDTVGTESKVRVAPLTSVKGARPLTVPNQQFVYNQLYTLKEGAGDGDSGNYGALALGGNGASVYRDNLFNGFQSTLKVGDIVFTETGNIAQATRQGVQSLIDQDPNSTYDNFDKGSPRMIVIPIVNTLDVDGKKPITVVGFGSFFLEGLAENGGHTEIIGRFLEYVASGDSSDAQTDYGLKGMKLIK